jgi:hypothetical protein
MDLLFPLPLSRGEPAQAAAHRHSPFLANYLIYYFMTGKWFHCHRMLRSDGSPVTSAGLLQPLLLGLMIIGDKN